MKLKNISTYKFFKGENIWDILHDFSLFLDIDQNIIQNFLSYS